MPAPQSRFMSKINNQKRLSRTSPANMPDEEDRLHAVHQYKKCMEDVKNECPNLSSGAQHQLALERCAKMQNGHQGLRKKRPTVLGEMMSRLRIGKSQQLDDADDVGIDEIGATIGSTGLEDPDVPGTSRARHRSLAVRQSVASLTEESHDIAAQTAIADLSENEESLQDSLDNIERNHGNNFEQSFSTKSSNSSSRRANRRPVPDSKRQSRRVSALSLDLSDVEEDGGSVTSEKDKPNHSFKGRSDPSCQRRNQKHHQSVTDILPDEIKIALQDFSFGDGSNNQNNSRNPVPAPSRNITSDRRNRQANGIRQSDVDEEGNNSSFMSSFLSADSANFKGDFSAWSSFRRGS